MPNWQIQAVKPRNQPLGTFRKLACRAAALALLASGIGIAPAHAAPADLVGMWQFRFGEWVDKSPPPPRFTAQATAQVQGYRRAVAAGYVRSVSNMKCLPNGIFGVMLFRSPIEILAGMGRISITPERDAGGDEPRTIYLDKPQAEDPDLSWNGHSVGRWDQDRLIVDTRGFNGRGLNFWVGGIPVPLSPTARISEIFRLENDGKVLVDEVTVDDPEVLAEPYKGIIRFDRLPDDTERMEAVCEVDLAAIAKTDLTKIQDVDIEARRMISEDHQYNSADHTATEDQNR